MEKDQFDNLKSEKVLEILANQELFGQWLRTFFFLNVELHKQYDSIYQSHFYIKFYEVVTTGLEYAEKIFKAVENTENIEKKEFYKKLVSGLIDLKSEFSESEFEFIEYKRHSAAHIFQKGYSKQITNNNVITSKYKKKLIDILNRDFEIILLKHGFDRGFDEYMNTKLYPKVLKLYNQLEQIKKD